MIPAKHMHGLTSHSECQGKSYCHMLASPDLTINKLTIQNKVGVKKKKKKQEEVNSNIKQHWWVYHHGATWQGDLCRLEMRLHQQTLHFKVWDERVPPLTFCSITGSGLKEVCTRYPCHISICDTDIDVKTQAFETEPFICWTKTWNVLCCKDLKDRKGKMMKGKP